MQIIKPNSVLAATTGEGGANKFFTTDIGKAFVALCGVFAIVIVVTCVFKMVKSVTSGRPGEGFKVLIFGLLIGGLLFNLGITVDGVKYMSTLIGKVFTSASSITG